MNANRFSITICVGVIGLAIAAGVGYSQDITPLESLQPISSPLHSIMRAEGAWAAGQPAANITEYEFDFTAMPGLNLRQQYNQSIITHKNAVLNTGLEENLINELSLELTSRTNLAFAREVKTVKDLQQILLSGTTTKSLNLSQGFGAGHSSGVLGFEQIETSKFAGANDPEELLTRIMSLNTGLGEGYNLVAKLTNTDAPDVLGLHRRQTEATLAMPLSGGDGQISYSKLTESEGIHSKSVKSFDVLAPLALFGGEAKAEYHRSLTVKDGTETKERTVKLFTPLESIRSGATFLYSSEPVHRKGKPTQQVRNVELYTPLGFLGTTSTLKLQRGAISEPGRHERLRGAHLTALVQGKDMSLRTKSRRVDSDGTLETIREYWLDTPNLSLLNDTANLEYHLYKRDNNGEKSQRPRMALSVPLGFVDDEAILTHNIEQIERKNKPTQELRTSDFQMPFSLFGTAAKLEQNRVTLRETDRYEIRYRSYLAVAMNGEKLELERRVTNIPGDEGTARERRFSIQTPKFELFTDWAGLKGNHIVTEYSDKPSIRTTSIDLTAQPFKSLDLTGNYYIRDAGDGQDSRTRKLHGTLKLSDTLALKGRFDQSNTADNEATILRNVYLTKDKNGDNGLGIQVGYTTWGGLDQESDSASDIRFAWGNPKHLGLNLQLTEYDAKKWSLLDEPIIEAAIQHGESDRLNIKFEYGDQPGRPARKRGIHLSLPALGGAMKLGYVNNPLGRHGKSVLPATRYDLGFSRQIFGGVNLDVGYRYCDFREQVLPEQVVQYLKLQLVGGAEDAGGKIDLSYQSGDFVPQPNPKKVVPAALLDLSYTKNWGDQGSLVLSLHRVTPPANSQDIKKSCEGRLEYSAAF